MHCEFCNARIGYGERWCSNECMKASNADGRVDLDEPTDDVREWEWDD